MSIFISGGGFNYEIASVGGKWAWKITANNIVNSGQYYYVTDINTPFGKLSEVDTPIPDAVITAMFQSLTSFQQQLTPVLNLVSANSINITVSEGNPVQYLPNISISNIGALGSFLSASFTSSASYLTVNPSQILGISKNQVSSASVYVDPATLLSTSSPYSATINVQNLANQASVIPVSYSITVLPRPTILVAPASINFTFNLSTQIGSGPVTIDIENSGPGTSLLSVFLNKIQNKSPWLTFTPSELGPIASTNSLPVVFTLDTTKAPQIAGLYTETISVSSFNATNTPVAIPVTLTVS